jgi:DNA-binding SARP family transcriptional activator
LVTVIRPADPLAGRVTTVIAAAGYGKTTAVRTWLGDRPARWYRGGGPPSTGAPESGAAATVTVIDDAHLAGAAPPYAGAGGPVVLIARRRVPAALLRWAGELPAELGAAHLALSADGTADLLRRRYGVADPELAGHLYPLTGGWPALIQLAGSALVAGTVRVEAGATREDLLAALSAPGTLIAGYLRAEILADLPDATRRLFLDAAWLGAVSPDLATGLGHPRAERAVDDLTRLGLLRPPDPGGCWHTPVPLLAAVIRAERPRSAGGQRRRRRVLAAAARWHGRAARPADALRLLLAAGDQDGCARLLTERGTEILAAGAAAEVVAAVRAMAVTDERLDLVLAEALEMTGDSVAAIGLYAAMAGEAATLSPALAWRYGVAVYLWGDPHNALGVFQRGRLAGGETRDEALLLAWMAAAHWLAGDRGACRDCADRAVRAAEAAGDDRARATAEVALALGANLDGDPVALRAHYTRALALAEAAGDVVQVVRIRANTAAAQERENRYLDALETLRPAVALAERAGHRSLLAMALSNQAGLLHRLGRLPEAAAGYQRSIEIYQQIDSRKVAYPLNGLGDLHRQCGRASEARTAYEQAVRAAGEDGNRQGLVPALAGLARVLAGEDPGAAGELADRALEHASGPFQAMALLAAGHALLGAGEVERARERAAAAAEAARRHRGLLWLAEALELRAAAGARPAQSRQALREALAIWRDADAVLDVDRVRFALGQVPGAREEERAEARLAASRLAAAGVILPPPAPDPTGPPRVAIRTFGQFTVVVDDAPVPALAWQSRKARDLVRILVARRGRPVSRAELIELLWGEADGDARAVHRLAVALSTARGIFDPQRRAPAEQVIGAGTTNVWINLDRVPVDVENFLGDAQHGLRLLARGAADEAWEVLAAAERSYTAEVFADEPYDDWAQPLREEAQAAWLSVLRALVRLGWDDPDGTVPRLRRILAAEPYDEGSHRDLLAALVGAGRHGEARRAYDRYARAMADIGVAVPERAAALAAQPTGLGRGARPPR